MKLSILPTSEWVGGEFHRGHGIGLDMSGMELE